MTKYTPGPWRLVDVRHQKNGNIRIFSDAMGCYGRIAEVSHQSLECEANARLIAAAPELLDALKEVFNYGLGNDFDWMKWAEKAQAAIRKATAMETSE